MRMSAACAWQRRWARMLSVSAVSAFANSLVLPAHRGCYEHCDGPGLTLSELFAGRCIGEDTFANTAFAGELAEAANVCSGEAGGDTA